MKKVSNSYKKAMDKLLRDRSYMMVSVGIISSEAQSTAKVVSDSHYLSNNVGLFRNSSIDSTYATFEENVFKLDGSMLFPPKQTGYEQLVSNTGFLSNDIMGSITIEFDKPYDIKGLTINFGEYYPTEFTISKNNGTPQTFTNSSEMFTNEVSYNEAKTITITPVSFVNGNNKRLRINSILMGVGLMFQNEDIEAANFTDSASFISEELPQIDFNITCFDRYKKFNVDDNNSFINYLEIGQEIITSTGIELEDGTIEWVKMPTTYLSSWSSDTSKISFSAVDRLAFLTAKYEGGNTIHTRTLYDDAVAVLTDAGLASDEYSIDDYLRTITVENPLPLVSHAECLQLIANAGKCLLKQDTDGRITITANFENILAPTEISVESSTHTDWSKPENIIKGAYTVYADFSNESFVLDGSKEFMPQNKSDYGTTGYVSDSISDYGGYFIDNIIPFTNKITPEMLNIMDLFGDNSPFANIDNERIKFQNDGSIVVKLVNPSEGAGFLYSTFVMKAGTYILSMDKKILSGSLESQIMMLLFDVEEILTTTSGSVHVVGWLEPNQDSVIVTLEEDKTVLLEFGIEPNSNEQEKNVIVQIKPFITNTTIENDHLVDIDDNINFTGHRPRIKIKLPTTYTYHSLFMEFDNAITGVKIRTYNDGQLLAEYTEYQNTESWEINHSFYSFDEMEIEIIGTVVPYQRAVLNKLSFGDLSDYNLIRNNMLSNPIGTVNPKTQSVSVKVFTFENDENDVPKQIDDDVYYTYTVGSTGESVTFANQLISTQEHAEEVAKWLANYYANNITYDVSFRGEPRIESADYIYLESEIINNLQVEVESVSLDFSGSISGQLSLRRAVNMLGEE